MIAPIIAIVVLLCAYHCRDWIAAALRMASEVRAVSAATIQNFRPSYADRVLASIQHDMTIAHIPHGDPRLKVLFPTASRLQRQFRRLQNATANDYTSVQAELRYECAEAAYAYHDARYTQSYIAAVPADLRNMVTRYCIRRVVTSTSMSTYLLGAPYSELGLPSKVTVHRGYVDMHWLCINSGAVLQGRFNGVYHNCQVRINLGKYHTSQAVLGRSSFQAVLGRSSFQAVLGRSSFQAVLGRSSFQDYLDPVSMWQSMPDVEFTARFAPIWRRCQRIMAGTD